MHTPVVELCIEFQKLGEKLLDASSDSKKAQVLSVHSTELRPILRRVAKGDFEGFTVAALQYNLIHHHGLFMKELLKLNKMTIGMSECVGIILHGIIFDWKSITDDIRRQLFDLMVKIHYLSTAFAVINRPIWKQDNVHDADLTKLNLLFIIANVYVNFIEGSENYGHPKWLATEGFGFRVGGGIVNPIKDPKLLPHISSPEMDAFLLVSFVCFARFRLPMESVTGTHAAWIWDTSLLSGAVDSLGLVGQTLLKLEKPKGVWISEWNCYCDVFRAMALSLKIGRPIGNGIVSDQVMAATLMALLPTLPWYPPNFEPQLELRRILTPVTMWLVQQIADYKTWTLDAASLSSTIIDVWYSTLELLDSCAPWMTQGALMVDKAQKMAYFACQVIIKLMDRLRQSLNPDSYEKAFAEPLHPFSCSEPNFPLTPTGQALVPHLLRAGILKALEGALRVLTTLPGGLLPKTFLCGAMHKSLLSTIAVVVTTMFRFISGTSHLRKEAMSLVTSMRKASIFWASRVKGLRTTSSSLEEITNHFTAASGIISFNAAVYFSVCERKETITDPDETDTKLAKKTEKVKEFTLSVISGLLPSCVCLARQCLSAIWNQPERLMIVIGPSILPVSSTFYCMTKTIAKSFHACGFGRCQPLMNVLAGSGSVEFLGEIGLACGETFRSLKYNISAELPPNLALALYSVVRAVQANLRCSQLLYDIRRLQLVDNALSMQAYVCPYLSNPDNQARQIAAAEGEPLFVPGKLPPPPVESLASHTTLQDEWALGWISIPSVTFRLKCIIDKWGTGVDDAYSILETMQNPYLWVLDNPKAYTLLRAGERSKREMKNFSLKHLVPEMEYYLVDLKDKKAEKIPFARSRKIAGDHWFEIRDTMGPLIAQGPAQWPSFSDLCLSHGAVGCCNPACGNLFKTSESLLETKTCAGCRIARYCCRACQTYAWQRHKAFCLKTQAQRQAAEMAPAGARTAD